MDISGITRIEEAIRYGNSYLLKASEQSGFLAAALIAAFSVWKSEQEAILLDDIAFVSLALSIFCSIFTHFVIGNTYISQMKKVIDNQEIKHAFYITLSLIHI